MRVKRNTPIHGSVCDALTQVCNDAVDALSAEFILQQIFEEKEVKKKAEQEEEHRRVKEEQAEEARDLMARLKVLQAAGAAAESDANNSCVEIESEDEAEYITHDPVSPLVYSCSILLTLSGSPAIGARRSASSAKVRKAWRASPAAARACDALWTEVNISSSIQFIQY